jgi:hypothetical protein
VFYQIYFNWHLTTVQLDEMVTTDNWWTMDHIKSDKEFEELRRSQPERKFRKNPDLKTGDDIRRKPGTLYQAQAYDYVEADTGLNNINWTKLIEGIQNPK